MKYSDNHEKQCIYNSLDVDNSVLFIPCPYLNKVFERSDRYLHFKGPIFQSLRRRQFSKRNNCIVLVSCIPVDDCFADSDVKLNYQDLRNQSNFCPT
jgi:hypothetical protein